MRSNLIKSFVFLILFSSCVNNQNEELIFQLKKENDSLKSIILNYNQAYIDKIFIMYSNKNNRQIGALSEYGKPLPEYYLIRKNKEKSDTLIKKGTEALIRLKENDKTYNDSLTSYELHLKDLGIIYDARKIH